MSLSYSLGFLKISSSFISEISFFSTYGVVFLRKLITNSAASFTPCSNRYLLFWNSSVAKGIDLGDMARFMFSLES